MLDLVLRQGHTKSGNSRVQTVSAYHTSLKYSLRWHYPNQVYGSKIFPLSPAVRYKLRNRQSAAPRYLFICIVTQRQNVVKHFGRKPAVFCHKSAKFTKIIKLCYNKYSLQKNKIFLKNLQRFPFFICFISEDLKKDTKNQPCLP